MARIWFSLLCLMCLLGTLSLKAASKKAKPKKVKKVWSRFLQKDIQALQTNVSHLWKEMREKESHGVNIHVHGIGDEPEKDHMGDGTHVHIHMHLDDGGHGHGCGHHGDHHDYDDHSDHDDHHDHHDDHHGHHNGDEDHGEDHEGHDHARESSQMGSGKGKGKKKQDGRDTHQHKTGDHGRSHRGHRDHYHHTHHPDHNKYMYAICNMAMNPTLKRTNHNIRGSVYLRQKAHGPVAALIKLEGFNIQGQGEGHDHVHHVHGFHVHAYGDGTNGCQSYGGHYNPDGAEHGSPDAEHRHSGDWGNIRCDDQGVVDANLTDHESDLWGPHSIVGRGIVIHEHEDDLGTKNTVASRTAGDAGGRLACCVIAWSKDQDWSKLE